MKGKHTSFKSEWKKGTHPSPRTEFKKGGIPWHKGSKGLIKFSDGSRRKLSLQKLGVKNPMWQGGKSHEVYPVDWTRTLKRSIRERDRYICQICSGNGFYVHHIDYNKKNCNPENLITLCRKCHLKTNHNRNNWINFFKTQGGSRS
jgi:hypothetical protein